MQQLEPPRPVTFRSNHASNCLPLAGIFPDDRERLLALIALARGGAPCYGRSSCAGFSGRSMPVSVPKTPSAWVAALINQNMIPVDDGNCLWRACLILPPNAHFRSLGLLSLFGAC